MKINSKFADYLYIVDSIRKQIMKILCGYIQYNIDFTKVNKTNKVIIIHLTTD